MPSDGNGKVEITMLDIYEKLEEIEDSLGSYVTWKALAGSTATLIALGGFILALVS